MQNNNCGIELKRISSCQSCSIYLNPFHTRYVRSPQIPPLSSSVLQHPVSAHMDSQFEPTLHLKAETSTAYDFSIDIDHRKRRRNRTTQSCLNCHTSKRKVGCSSSLISFFLSSRFFFFFSFSVTASALVSAVSSLAW